MNAMGQWVHGVGGPSSRATLLLPEQQSCSSGVMACNSRIVSPARKGTSCIDQDSFRYWKHKLGVYIRKSKNNNSKKTNKKKNLKVN